jgi:diguanylate cyclase (GGDEF)-like protein
MDISTTSTQVVSSPKSNNVDSHFAQIMKRVFEDIVFYYDFQAETLELYGKELEKLKLASVVENFPDGFVENDYVYKDDVQVFRQSAANMLAHHSGSVEFRLNRLSGEPEWHRIEYEYIQDTPDATPEVVGKIVNIEETKLLEYQASRDSLTNSLNKSTTEKMINRIFSESLPNTQHALLVLDVDNFKDINDKLGHHYGDYVLTETVKTLKSLLRHSDFVGRIGGDEFVVFMRNVKDTPSVLKKARIINQAFCNHFSADNGHPDVSLSIGVAVYPRHGRTYSELFENGDRALYVSKREGKNQSTLYDESVLIYDHRNQKPFTNAKELLSRYFEGELIFRVSDFLYETQDLSFTINAILKMLGETFQVDRCYIFEEVDEGKFYSNTYEWCKDPSNAEINTLQRIPVEALEPAFEHYNSEGIFYTNKIDALPEDLFHMLDRQNILSMLHCGVRKNGLMRVIVGFDDCTQHRIWTDKEIATLLYVSKLIALHLIHQQEIRLLSAKADKIGQ